MNCIGPILRPLSFNSPTAKWIELLRSCGFEIEELHETRRTSRWQEPVCVGGRELGSIVAYRGGLGSQQEAVTVRSY